MPPRGRLFLFPNTVYFRARTALRERNGGPAGLSPLGVFVMKTIGILLLLILLPGSFGCGGKANEGINRDKDKPRPDPKMQAQTGYRANGLPLRACASVEAQGCAPGRHFAGYAPSRLGWILAIS